MSISGDGKMLVWKFDRKTKKLELNSGWVLCNDDIYVVFIGLLACNVIMGR